MGGLTKSELGVSKGEIRAGMFNKAGLVVYPSMVAMVSLELEIVGVFAVGNPPKVEDSGSYKAV